MKMSEVSKVKEKEVSAIGVSMDDIAENLIVEKYRGLPSDRTRKTGIFLAGEVGQKTVKIVIHGFVAKCTLTGNGSWFG